MFAIPLRNHAVFSRGVETQLTRCICSLLDKIQPRVVSYEEQVTTVREHLASLLEQEEEWSKAAQTLAGIDLDSGKLICVPGICHALHAS